MWSLVLELSFVHETSSVDSQASPSRLDSRSLIFKDIPLSPQNSVMWAAMAAALWLKSATFAIEIKKSDWRYIFRPRLSGKRLVWGKILTFLF